VRPPHRASQAASHQRLHARRGLPPCCGSARGRRRARSAAARPRRPGRRCAASPASPAGRARSRSGAGRERHPRSGSCSAAAAPWAQRMRRARLCTARGALRAAQPAARSWPVRAVGAARLAPDAARPHALPPTYPHRKPARQSRACLGDGRWAACGQALLDAAKSLDVPLVSRQRHPRAGPARLVLLLAQLRWVCQVLQRAAAALAKVLAARRHLRRFPDPVCAAHLRQQQRLAGLVYPVVKRHCDTTLPSRRTVGGHLQATAPVLQATAQVNGRGPRVGPPRHLRAVKQVRRAFHATRHTACATCGRSRRARHVWRSPQRGQLDGERVARVYGRRACPQPLPRQRVLAEHDKAIVQLAQALRREQAAVAA